MLNCKINILFFYAFFLLGSVLPQQKEIADKQTELGGLREQIESIERELKDIGHKEKQNYNVIEKYSKQNHLINKLINNYRTDVREKEKEITSLQKEIASLENTTKKLKDNYAKYISSVYKGTYKSDLMYILDAESLQQAVLRYKYLQEFSSQRKKDLEKIKRNKEQLVEARIRLNKERATKNDLLSVKEKEEKVLQNQISERKQIVSRLRNNKSALKKELDAKKMAEKEIRKLITRLIEKEEARKREEAKRLAEAKSAVRTTVKGDVSGKTVDDALLPQTFSEVNNLSSFANLRGRMSWPISKGTIIKKYGENTNSQLKTVTINYGIDIKASGDLNVRAVADGIVSTIDWLPGYGSILILTHKDGFRTVYGHLSSITVTEGERIRPGEIIGKVGESLEGNILHFEVWNQRNNQNPEIWLAKR
ncbi:MAG TPA: peptidoglycan DD-metalloendopeptidase family protein [Ignavibacteriaceae bacterium]|nr:peptidoglycan DD-metalloendopeptidase family protein [Ignavibacteriaceae bacterium]